MRHRRIVPALVSLSLAAMIAGGTYFGGTALDHWLSRYSAIDLAAPKGVEENLPPDEMRDKRTARLIGKNFMMTASHPAAAQAGGEILSKGGSALDAIIASQAVAGLVQPYATGFGGGGVLLYWNHDSRQLSIFDGRGIAPQAVDRRIFLNENSSLREIDEVSHGGGAILVPGLAHLLQSAREKHGGLPLSKLFSPAMELARKGFPLDPVFIHHINETGWTAESDELAVTPLSGQLKLGARVTNDRYFDFLSNIATNGFQAFYLGGIADEIVTAVQEAPGTPGSLTLQDMQYYAALNRTAKCMSYRGFRLCGPPAPSEGSLSVLQTLGILEGMDLSGLSDDEIYAIQIITEASKLGQADRDRYVADSAFAQVPSQGLLNKSYLQLRALEINTSSSGKIAAKAGLPPNAGNQLFGSQAPKTNRIAAHFIATDNQGNIAILISGLEQVFGSRVSVHGFYLNNGLLGFSTRMNDAGAPIRNRIEPEKRPGYDWAPMLVFGADGLPSHALALSGGSDLTAMGSKSLISILDWGHTPQTAFALPHYSFNRDTLRVEVNTGMSEMAVRLRNRGYQVRLGSFPSDFQAISLLEGTGAISAVDPRSQAFAVSERNLMAATADAFQFIIPPIQEKTVQDD